MKFRESIESSEKEANVLTLPETFFLVREQRSVKGDVKEERGFCGSNISLYLDKIDVLTSSSHLMF